MARCSEETWTKLANQQSVTISEAVLLAADVEPTQTVLDALEETLKQVLQSDRKGRRRQLEEIIEPEIVTRILAMYEASRGFGFPAVHLRTFNDETLINEGRFDSRDGVFYRCRVRPTDFALYCHLQGWPTPDGLARLVRPRDLGSKTDVALVWPWGRYETEMLRHLHAAILRWWIRYDPSDPSTAPTQKDVVDWLRSERGVSETAAEAIARVIHTDDPLPKGPRRPK